MAVVDSKFREWIAVYKKANPSVADARVVLDTAQYAFAAGRDAQREHDAALHAAPEAVALRTAMTTLEQIASAPDDQGAKFNAMGALRFLQTQPVELRAAPVGFVMVPVEPTVGLLMSMAIRRDHGLGRPGYYDDPAFGGAGWHQRRLDAALGYARQQHEEVVGHGFYSADREQQYASLAARPQGVKDGN